MVPWAWAGGDRGSLGWPDRAWQPWPVLPSQGRAGWGAARSDPSLGIRHLLGNGDRLRLGQARAGGDSVLQPQWGRD